MFKNLVWLSVSGNNLEILDGNTFKESTGILYIDFSNNNIKEIPTNFFVWSRNVREFNIEKNKIEVLTWTTFWYLEQLEILKIGYNKLTQIDWNWTVSKVRIFDVRENSCINIQLQGNKDELVRRLSSSCAPKVTLLCEFEQVGEGKFIYSKSEI